MREIRTYGLMRGRWAVRRVRRTGAYSTRATFLAAPNDVSRPAYRRRLSGYATHNRKARSSATDARRRLT